MKSFKSWNSLVKRRSTIAEGGRTGWKMKPIMILICMILLIVWYRTTNIQYQQTEIEEKLYPFDTLKEPQLDSQMLKGLPRGIIQSRSDLESKPLWSTNSSRSKAAAFSNRNLLAMPVGIKQKDNVDAIVQKFLAENFTVILFHYDGKMDGWWDLEWSTKAIHIVLQNQTKWWYAKRFLHPDVVSIYDYIFLWDEDLGVKNFHPGRYLEIVKAEGLHISQPALDPNSTEIHHRITVRSKRKTVHRRVYDSRGKLRCSDAREGPPCSGFVEGMAPVFSRPAWYCTWHLIQNDLVHGWGMDMKLGYCAQGDRTRNVGIVDKEYVFHQGIQTLGESGHLNKQTARRRDSTKRRSTAAFDSRTEIRRQSTWELQVFKERWNRAVKEDKSWVNPFGKQ